MHRKRIALAGAGVLIAAISFYAGRWSATERLSTAESRPGPLPSSANALPDRSPAPRTVPAAVSWDDQWKTLLARSGSPARDQDMLAAIGDLATREPLRAISLALAESHLRLKQDMLRAALSGWGQTAPDAAAEWVFTSTQGTLDKVDAVTSVLRAVLKADPDQATQLTKRLLEKYPDRAQQLGIAFVSELGANGNFKEAAEFAAAAKPEDLADWMSGAYANWAEYQPQDALASANKLADPEAKGLALDAIISRWAYNDPKAVIELAPALPPQQRALALADALRNWAAENPAEAAEWLNRTDAHPELDMGIASVATSYQLAQKSEIALGWAESIVDAELRSCTVAEVVREWAAADPAAARRYVESSKHLQQREREVLLSEFAQPQPAKSAPR